MVSEFCQVPVAAVSPQSVQLILALRRKCFNEEIVDKEKRKDDQGKQQGYDFNFCIGNKIRAFCITDLPCGHIGVYRDTKPHNAYIFLAFPAVAKLSGIHGKRILIPHQVIPDILIINIDVFQFLQVFIQPNAFSFQMSPGVQAVLSPKKGKGRINNEKCPDYKEIPEKSHGSLIIGIFWL
jgi:hypothetical protein